MPDAIGNKTAHDYHLDVPAPEQGFFAKGLGHGDWALVEQYHMDLYFESAGMILTLITLGKFLETRSKGKTGRAITRLMDLAPKTASVLRGGVEVEIPA